MFYQNLFGENMSFYQNFFAENMSFYQNLCCKSVVVNDTNVLYVKKLSPLGWLN